MPRESSLRVVNRDLPSAIQTAQASSNAFLNVSNPLLLDTGGDLFTDMSRFGHHIDEFVSSVGEDQKTLCKLEREELRSAGNRFSEFSSTNLLITVPDLSLTVFGRIFSLSFQSVTQLLDLSFKSFHLFFELHGGGGG